MNTLLLIRHAQTDMAGTFCGSSDPPLNSSGREQVTHLVDRLRVEKIDVVYTSDRQRASETARAIASARNVPCFVRPALREIDFGRWEGLRWHEIETADPDYSSEWLRLFPALPAPGGEDVTNFESRVLEEANYLLHDAQFENIALVAHAGVLRAILSHCTTMDDRQAWKHTDSYGAALRLECGVVEAIV